MIFLVPDLDKARPQPERTAGDQEVLTNAFATPKTEMRANERMHFASQVMRSRRQVSS